MLQHRLPLAKAIIWIVTFTLSSMAIVSTLLPTTAVPARASGVCPTVQNTPSFTIVYGTAALNSQAAPLGTVVEARSPRGDTVGCFVVSTAGQYGTMYVYGEDTSVSPTIPGMRAGETIAFFINSVAASASPALTWSNDLNLHEVNLSATGTFAPVANFSATPTSGSAPLAVQFTDGSSGDISSRAWTFGDGSTSLLTSPSHTYNAPGVYTVTLTVNGPGGSDSETKQSYITVSDALAVEANFTATPRTGAAPLAVAFRDQSVGTVTAWSWNFGDGGTSSAPDPDHTYSAAGVYTVSLTVNGASATDTLTKTNYITVTAPTSVQANFSATPTSGLLPLQVQFTDQSTGGVNLRVWNFGDGQISTAQHPSHTYSSAGIYTVTLIASGPQGNDTEIKSGYITVYRPAVAAFTASPTQGEFPLTVQFTDQSTGSLNFWLWNFGNGQVSTEQHPSHTFSSAGDYTVTLTVNGPSGTDSEIRANYISVKAVSAGNRVYLPLLLK